jgi:hypothetical protein
MLVDIVIKDYYGAYDFKYPWVMSFLFNGKNIDVYATSSLKYLLIFENEELKERIGFKKGLKKLKDMLMQLDLLDTVRVRASFYFYYWDLLEKA